MDELLPLRVVYLEDNAALRRLLPRVGAHYNLDIHAVATPDLLFEELAENGCDAVVSDFELGATTSAKVIQRLRSWGCPVVVWTGTPSAALASGLPEDVPVVSKSASASTLADAVRAAISASTATDPEKSCKRSTGPRASVSLDRFAASSEGAS